jgi:hypothetical protein
MWFLLHTPGARELIPATTVVIQELCLALLSAHSFRRSTAAAGLNSSTTLTVTSTITSTAKSLFAPSSLRLDLTLTSFAALLSSSSALLLWLSVARLDAAVVSVAWEARAVWAGALAAMAAWITKTTMTAPLNSSPTDDDATASLSVETTSGLLSGDESSSSSSIDVESSSSSSSSSDLSLVRWAGVSLVVAG